MTQKSTVLTAVITPTGLKWWNLIQRRMSQGTQKMVSRLERAKSQTTRDGVALLTVSNLPRPQPYRTTVEYS